MKIHFKTSRLTQACVAVICALVLLDRGAFAQAEAIRVEITSEHHLTIMQGEPLVLHYVIANDSTKPVAVGMGQDGAIGGTEWITRSLKSVSGENTPPLDNPYSSDRGGVHFNTLLLSPEDQREGNLVVSQWFSIPHPGRYILSLKVRLTYGSGQNVDEAIKDGLVTPKSFIQDCSFLLTVTAADPKRLQALAMSLGQAVTHSEDPHQVAVLMQELVSMPESEAWPVWTELANKPVLQSTLASDLARFPTVRTADILSQMAWPSANRAASTQAIKQLSEMYNHSSGVLKEHIKVLYGAHGINLPEQILTLQNG